MGILVFKVFLKLLILCLNQRPLLKAVMLSSSLHSSLNDTNREKLTGTLMQI